MELQTIQKLKTSKKKFVYKNGATHITLDDLTAPSYQEVTNQIKKRVGDRPALPEGLAKGIGLLNR